MSKQTFWKTKSFLLVIAFVAVLLAAAAYYAPSVSSLTWAKYENREFGFSIKYPEGWKYDNQRFATIYKAQGDKMTVGFGPTLAERAIGEARTPENSPVWGVSAMEDAIEVESRIALIGTDSTERKESREQISIHGLPATLITITRGDAGPETSIVLIQHGNMTYILSDGSNLSEDFTAFYNSFRLLGS